MVADRLGVRRADADIDEGDAAAVGRDQMIGGHLVPPPGAVGDKRTGVDAGLVDVEPRGAGECGIAALSDLRRRPRHEFVDIAMIVGEQYVALEMFGRGAGVVAEAREREIGTQRVEQRERLRRRWIGAEQTVGKLVADIGKLGGREMAREFEWGDPAHVRSVAGIEHIREGDLLPGARDFERDVIVAREQAELVAQIFGEEVGARHGGDKFARALKLAKGEIMPLLPFALFAGGGQADRRIVEQSRRRGIGRWQGAIADIGSDGVFEVGDRGAEPVLQFGDDLFDEGGRVGDVGAMR